MKVTMQVKVIQEVIHITKTFFPRLKFKASGTWKLSWKLTANAMTRGGLATVKAAAGEVLTYR